MDTKNKMEISNEETKNLKEDNENELVENNKNDEINKNNVEHVINLFIQIGIMPLLLISFLRHTLFSGSIIKSHNFF